MKILELLKRWWNAFVSFFVPPSLPPHTVEKTKETVKEVSEVPTKTIPKVTEEMFKKMESWTREEIEKHGIDTMNINLDRRKTPVNMVKDYREAYNNWVKEQKKKL